MENFYSYQFSIAAMESNSLLFLKDTDNHGKVQMFLAFSLMITVILGFSNKVTAK